MNVDCIFWFALFYVVCHAPKSWCLSKLITYGERGKHLVTPENDLPWKVNIHLHGKKPYLLKLKRFLRPPFNNRSSFSKDAPICFTYHGTLNEEGRTNVFLDLCYELNGNFSIDDASYKARRRYYLKTPWSLLNSLQAIRLFEDNDATYMTKDRTVGVLYQRQRRAIKNTNMKFLEIYIVNDNSIYEFFGRNVSFIEERSAAIAKMLDDKYRYLGLRIVLVGVDVWTQNNLIEVTSSAHATLLNFMKYRRHHVNHRIRNDNAQFITRTSFDNGRTAGKAPIATICSQKYSAGINRDSNSDPKYVANIIAHELGHNLGMHHDDPGKCFCLGHPKRKCIMNHQIDSKVNQFSTCSRNYLDKHLLSGHGGCLFDFPSHMKKPAICGNGIIEVGEECDCGHPEECSRLGNCCNQITCQLFSNASCASGGCCHRCQLKAKHSLCRQQNGECDFAEFCDGVRAICPHNVHLQDTYTCGGGKGYCMGGVCMTHQHQCEEIFESGSANGHCYTELNTKGTEIGYCGKVNSGYEPCRAADAYCGKLQCETKRSSVVLTMKNALKGIIKSTIRWSDDAINKTCVSKNYRKTNHANDGNLALARDGTRCGHHGICINQKCRIVTEYRQENTNIEECPRNCSFHGRCNSNNNCHCDEGWAPPFCDKSGLGGSIDSGSLGPKSVLMDKLLYVIAGLVFIAVAIPTTALSIVQLVRKMQRKCKRNKQKNREEKETLLK